jgi:pyridoxal phosphate enzyme (YggS family)
MFRVEEPPLDEARLRERLASLERRLQARAEAAGRDPDGFRVVAVTKGFGVDAVQLAVRAGLTRLGENRVLEALPKVAAEPAAEWHLIGHLQSNKARRAVEAFSWIHSIHEPALLDRIESLAHDANATPRLLLQVNLSGEVTKSGWNAERFVDDLHPRSGLVAALGRLRLARVVGLMTIAPFGATEDEARAVFRALRERRDRLEQLAGTRLPELSMGMSADAEAAVAEGATLVRIGTSLFGPRPA